MSYISFRRKQESPKYRGRRLLRTQFIGADPSVGKCRVEDYPQGGPQALPRRQFVWKLEVSFTGREAINSRIEPRNNDDIARHKSPEEQVANLIPVGSEVNLTNQPDWMGPAAPLVATFDVRIPGWSTLAGSRALVPVGLFGAPEKHVFKYTTRTYPISFYPSERQTISISTFRPTPRYPFCLNHSLMTCTRQVALCQQRAAREDFTSRDKLTSMCLRWIRSTTRHYEASIRE